MERLYGKQKLVEMSAIIEDAAYVIEDVSGETASLNGKYFGNSKCGSSSSASQSKCGNSRASSRTVLEGRV